MSGVGLILGGLEGDRHTQEPCRNGRGILTLILAVEQTFEFLLQVSSPTVLLRRFECIHGRPVVFPEFSHERRWLAAEVEGKRVPLEGDLLRENSCGGKPFDDVALDAPRHRADETFWRRRGVA